MQCPACRHENPSQWSGRIEEGVCCLQRARADYERTGIGYQQSLSVGQLGEAYLLAGQVDVATAEAHYGAAMSLASELEMRPLVAHCHLGLGSLYRRTGDPEQAREHLATARAMYAEMGRTY